MITFQETSLCLQANLCQDNYAFGRLAKMLGRRTWSCIAVIAAISTVAFLYQSKVNLVVFTSLPTKCNSCNQVSGPHASTTEK